jgi:beta-lactamase superfamily II metal-dependent hydrolase
VLVVGHHDSHTSSRRVFPDEVGATVFVISSGP